LQGNDDSNVTLTSSSLSEASIKAMLQDHTDNTHTKVSPEITTQIILYISELQRNLFITNHVQKVVSTTESYTTQIYSSFIVAAESKTTSNKKGNALISPYETLLVGGVSAPTEEPSHSTDQPGGNWHGQVKLATMSSKGIPENSATSKAEYTNTQQGLPVIGYTLVR
jgi:hypothetical protein